MNSILMVRRDYHFLCKNHGLKHFQLPKREQNDGRAGIQIQNFDIITAKVISTVLNNKIFFFDNLNNKNFTLL